MDKNTSGEMFDENVEVREGSTAGMTQAEILQSEQDLLNTLLEMSDGVNNPGNYEDIFIDRGGKRMLTFRVRPLKSKEVDICRKKATSSAKGRRREPEFDAARFSSLLIYTATVDEDRAKIWDNRAFHEKRSIMQPYETVDSVLHAGEIERVVDTIFEISGTFSDVRDETAKN